LRCRWGIGRILDFISASDRVLEVEMIDLCVSWYGLFFAIILNDLPSAYDIRSLPQNTHRSDLFLFESLNRKFPRFRF
jgi:hypothetical protein